MLAITVSLEERGPPDAAPLLETKSSQRSALAPIISSENVEVYYFATYLGVQRPSHFLSSILWKGRTQELSSRRVIREGSSDL